MNDYDRELLDKIFAKACKMGQAADMGDETRKKVSKEAERIFSSRGDGVEWIFAVLAVARCLVEEMEAISKMMEEYHENN